MTNEVAKKIDPMADFQAKLQKRVRDDIRDLLPEDAVAALVKNAVEDEFFKPRMVAEDRWSSPKERPSWFVEEVVKAAQPIIQDAVKAAIAAHPAAVEKVIKDFLDENKLAAATAIHLTGMLSAAVYTFQENMNNRS
jgi:hypothetical protein